MLTHTIAVASTLLIFLLIGVAYFGWGQIAAIIFGLARQTPASVALPIWLGWAFTLLLFQLLHCFLPITGYVVIPTLALGAVFAFASLLNSWRRLARQRSTLFLAVIAGVCILLVAAWVASKAMLTPINYDSSLYHFNAIRWLNAYPIVPGLGNLHARLAYNQSFFVYAATLNFYPWSSYGRSLANSFLLLLLIVTLLPSLLALVRQPSLLIEEHPFTYAVDLFVLPVVAYLAMSSDGLASPLPDLASTLLQLAMFVMLVHGLAAWIKGQKKQEYRATLLGVLAITAITIKLSNLAFSAVIISIIVVYTWQTSLLCVQSVTRALLPVCLITLIWLGRGVMLSGAPLFPATIGYMAVSWSVPRERLVEEANWIYSWARQPNTHWNNVLGKWDWFAAWSQNIRTRNVDIIYPLLSFVTLGFITFLVNILLVWQERRLPYWQWIILLPLLFALLYWFLIAPDPRFAHAAFWLLSISAALLLLASLQTVLKARWFLAVIGIIFIIANLHFIRFAVVHRSLLRQISLSGWHSAPQFVLTVRMTDSGLPVFVPASGNQCGDSPLPCTPDFNPKLRLRRSGELASGFTVMEPAEADELGAATKRRAVGQ